MTTYRSAKDIAVTVREQLKKQLPEWKFSVTIKGNSYYDSITVALMEGPEQVVEGFHEYVFGTGGLKRYYTDTKAFPGYAQLNHYQLQSRVDDPKRLSNGEYLTPKGWEVMKAATDILLAEHWDKSEVQVDYFSCNFYPHIHIGKWDKPYQVRGS